MIKLFFLFILIIFSFNRSDAKTYYSTIDDGAAIQPLPKFMHHKRDMKDAIIYNNDGVLIGTWHKEDFSVHDYSNKIVGYVYLDGRVTDSKGGFIARVPQGEVKIGTLIVLGRSGVSYDI